MLKMGQGTGLPNRTDRVNMIAWRGAPGRYVRVVATALSFALLAGCSGFGQKAPAPIYDLDAPRDFSGAKGRTRAQLLIPMPKAVQALDTNSIAVRSDGEVLTYLGTGQWSDRLPALLQARIVEAFENSGRVRAIGRPGEGLLINYQIATTVRQFELVVDGQSLAVVEIAAKIIDDRNGRVVATRTFRATAPTGGDTVGKAVKGLDRASSKVLVDLVEWVIAKV